MFTSNLQLYRATERFSLDSSTIFEEFSTLKSKPMILELQLDGPVRLYGRSSMYNMGNHLELKQLAVELTIRCDM